MNSGSTASTSTIRWDAWREAARRDKLLFHTIVFLIAFLILFSRRPDAILNAQFYAEDGKYWYADAYHFGWSCLLMPRWGYLQTVSRLSALFSLLFPLALAPLVMNLWALAFQILPANLFLSSRFDAIPMRARLLGSFLYLSLPNSVEVHANTTNIQWHLALAACMLLLGQPAEGKGWRFVGVSLLTLSILDGPLGMLLVPMLLALYWRRKDAYFVRLLVWLLPVISLQTLVIVFSGSRPPGILGANLARLMGILGGQLFFSALLGLKTFAQLYVGQAHSLVLIEAFATVIGLIVVLYSLRYGPFELKLFVVYATAVFGLSLLRPFTMMEGLRQEWEIMQVPGIANRYYFLPILAFLASLVWMLGVAEPTPKAARYAALAVLLLLPIGIYRDWLYPPYPQTRFREFAEQFERAAPGTKMTIPEGYPTDWRMVLIKR